MVTVDFVTLGVEVKVAILQLGQHRLQHLAHTDQGRDKSVLGKSNKIHQLPNTSRIDLDSFRDTKHLPAKHLHAPDETDGYGTGLGPIGQKHVLI